MSQPEVTILIPNYKTPELTKLCLRLFNDFTRPGRADFIVVDNDSGDESLAYLKTLPWIDLIERKVDSGESGPVMHANALDLGLQRVRTPFVLVVHTDTLPQRPDWLDYLLSEIRQSDKIAGVGSWKLEHISFWKKFGKRIEAFFQALAGRRKKEERYLRSHCALYRTELLRKYTHGFNDGDTAGRSIHRMLTEQGFEMRFLPSEILGRYILHLNHATGILNPPKGSRRCARPEAKRRLGAAMDSEFFRQVLSDPTLDQRPAATETEESGS